MSMAAILTAVVCGIIVGLLLDPVLAAGGKNRGGTGTGKTATGADAQGQGKQDRTGRGN